MPETNPFDTHPKVLACMDSGVGGLAVLRRFIEKNPHSGYVFLGDTAWMPYGEKPLSRIKTRVNAVHQWLQTQYPIGVFVLACNTATVAAYEDLIGLNLPYPVLEPVSTTAHWVNQHIETSQKIGILATPATVTSGRYLQLLDSAFDVTQVACKGLASVVEAGISSGPALDEVLLPYLAILKEAQVNVVISGCTHYSFILEVIQKEMGPEVQVIDSSEILAQTALPILEKLTLGEGKQALLVTGDPGQFAETISQLSLNVLKNISPQAISIESVNFSEV